MVVDCVKTSIISGAQLSFCATQMCNAGVARQITTDSMSAEDQGNVGPNKPVQAKKYWH